MKNQLNKSVSKYMWYYMNVNNFKHINVKLNFNVYATQNNTRTVTIFKFYKEIDVATSLTGSQFLTQHRMYAEEV
jgi:hypothetical protein